MCQGQKRCWDNAGNFGVVSTALPKYYSYHTEVFYKCFNDCMQCNAQRAQKDNQSPNMVALSWIP